VVCSFDAPLPLDDIYDVDLPFTSPSSSFPCLSSYTSPDYAGAAVLK